MMDGQYASASFFAPWDPTVEPYIRMATGDYRSQQAEHGRDHALAGYLGALAHEVVHYQQWLETGEMTERGVAVRSENMVHRYAQIVAHP